MINEYQFEIQFQYKGRMVSYTVYKMHISYSEITDFYRVAAKTGNRDLIRIQDAWQVCAGPSLPEEIVRAVGAAIEAAGH